jgi:hypothetical protein
VLGLADDARVYLSEWVAFDGRDAPHLTMMTIATGSRELVFSVAKRLDAIERADLPPELLQLAARKAGPGRFSGRHQAAPRRGFARELLP